MTKKSISEVVSDVTLAVAAFADGIERLKQAVENLPSSDELIGSLINPAPAEVAAAPVEKPARPARKKVKKPTKPLGKPVEKVKVGMIVAFKQGRGRVTGKVVSFSDDLVTIKTEDGKTFTRKPGKLAVPAKE